MMYYSVDDIARRFSHAIDKLLPHGTWTMSNRAKHQILDVHPWEKRPNRNRAIRNEEAGDKRISKRHTHSLGRELARGKAG
jgi:hypothetical protein